MGQMQASRRLGILRPYQNRAFSLRAAESSIILLGFHITFIGNNHQARKFPGPRYHHAVTVMSPQCTVDREEILRVPAYTYKPCMQRNLEAK